MGFDVAALFADEAALVEKLSWGMIINGVFVIVALMFLVAPYGKYFDQAKGLYGPLMNGKAGWIIQELPSLAMVLYFWWSGSRDPARSATLTTLTPQTVLLALFTFHYINRAVIYPLRIRGGKPSPVGVVAMAFFFCVVNGYMQGKYLTTFASYSPDTLTSPRFVVGVLLWAAGLAINWQSDDILRNLRKPGETGYKIPRGGMFEYVSGANFFGEILEWAGWALAAWNLPAAAFAWFTFANIAPRGVSHHKWYQSKFKDYPRSRKGVIPFIW